LAVALVPFAVFPEAELLLLVVGFLLVVFAGVPLLLLAGFFASGVAVVVCGPRANAVQETNRTIAPHKATTPATRNLVGTFITLCFVFQPTYPL
jgi:hypothetical protein